MSGLLIPPKPEILGEKKVSASAVTPVKPRR